MPMRRDRTSSVAVRFPTLVAIDLTTKLAPVQGMHRSKHQATASAAGIKFQMAGTLGQIKKYRSTISLQLDISWITTTHRHQP